MKSVDPYALVTDLNFNMLSTISLAGRINPVDTMLRYSMNEEVVSAISGLSPAQILHISRAPEFLFTVDEKKLIALLKDEVEGTGHGSMENAIQGRRGD